jgi:hypothetical protein
MCSACNRRFKPANGTAAVWLPYLEARVHFSLMLQGTKRRSRNPPGSSNACHQSTLQLAHLLLCGCTRMFFPAQRWHSSLRGTRRCTGARQKLSSVVSLSPEHVHKRMLLHRPVWGMCCGPGPHKALAQKPCSSIQVHVWQMLRSRYVAQVGACLMIAQKVQMWLSKQQPCMKWQKVNSSGMPGWKVQPQQQWPGVAGACPFGAQSIAVRNQNPRFPFTGARNALYSLRRGSTLIPRIWKHWACWTRSFPEGKPLPCLSAAPSARSAQIPASMLNISSCCCDTVQIKLCSCAAQAVRQCKLLRLLHAFCLQPQ